MLVTRSAGRLAMAILLLLAGCVTESATPRRSSSRNSGASLPDGPIATPARANTISSRVLLAISPVGTIAYDGQVLPLVSPDGRFCAVQEGDPPPWPALLATQDAQVPVGIGIVAYDLNTSPPARVPFPADLPDGLLLGRASDSRGFLVESPRPDGARWIGRIDWQTGRTEWLVRQDDVASHATMTADGSLLYTRRPIRGETRELVLMDRAGKTSVRSDPAVSYAMPMATADPATVYVLGISTAGIEIQAISVRSSGPEGTRLGTVLARSVVSRADTVFAAYQMAVSAPCPLPRTEAADPAGPDDLTLSIFSPAIGRMVAFDVRSGSLLPLAAGSVAATPWPFASRPGFLCTTANGLVFTPSPRPRQTPDSASPDARVLADPYIVRRTMNPQRPALLFGPVRTDPRRLQVIAIAPGDIE
ncbi:MAG: hypothetical protein KF787_03765 [Phycisphaeraceae bacterium]|nr:hypothetical protein [Phycisphaeraceae bacterium]